MAIPHLQSYGDPKQQKAYERCLAGQPLRKISGSVKVPLRTLARWSTQDGWIEERKARALATESPNVATAATESDTPVATASPAAESRTAGMERMLAAQQRIASVLTEALRKDVEMTVRAAETTGKPLSRSQISQLTTLTNNLFALERKSWCVPDKLEWEDTTPAAKKHVDTVRDLMLRTRQEKPAAADDATAGPHGPM